MKTESGFVEAFHYRLEALIGLQDGVILGYELLAGKKFCPAFDLRGWRLFYAYLITEMPKILKDKKGLIFFNLSGEQILDEKIWEIVQQYPVASQRLAIEWTEHSFRDEQTPDILVRIAQLKKMGFQISVDDIGSGVDGMGRAIACKPHFAKIDGSLLHHERTSDAATRHLYIRGMVDSLKSSGALVLVEWIETPEDHEVALKTGADFGQGFLWSEENA